MRFLALPVFALCLSFSAPPVHGQGALTPPGPPAPSQRTLAQVEPRTPIESLAGDSTAQYVISAPGSYYLANGNVSGASGRAAIAVTASDVSIDLNGFALLGAAGSTRGIEIRTAVANLFIGHGSIRNFPLAGIAYTGAPPVSVALERLSIGNITGGPGILLGDGVSSTAALRAERCVIQGVVGAGLQLSANGLVQSCSVNGVTGDANGGFGIQAGTVSDSEAYNITCSSGSNAYGINALSIRGCSVGFIDATNNGTSIGIQGRAIAHCAVHNVGRTGNGVSEGIGGEAISNCSVQSVGNGNSSSIQYGITCNGPVTDCSLSSIGGNANGIVTALDADSALRCRVGGATGKSTLTGISARVVTDCQVSSVSGIGGSGVVTAIQGEVVANCRANLISGVSSSPVVGVAAQRTIGGSGILGLSNAGTGGTVAIDLGAGATAENCNVSVVSGTGIRAIAAATVRHCSVTGSNGVTGIDLLATASECDGNKVNGCSTGIKAVGNTLVVRNHVTSTTTRFSVAGTVQFGPQVSAGGTIASTSPWANFTD